MLALFLLCALLAFPCIVKARDLQPILDAMDDPTIPVVGIHLSAYHHLKVPKDERMGKCEYCTECPDFVNFSIATNFEPCPERMGIFADILKTDYDFSKKAGEKYLSEYFGFTNTELIDRRRVHTRAGNFTPHKNQILAPEMNVTLTKLDVKDLAINKTFQKEGSTDNLSFDGGIFDINMVMGLPSAEGWDMVTETFTALKFIQDLPRKTVFLHKLQLDELKVAGCACIKNKIEHFKGSIEDLEELCRKGLKTDSEELRLAAKLSGCTTEEEQAKMKERNEKVQAESHTEL